ncbi:hypothetical protein Lpp219_11186 [Lacticaseibacillus paracasei subsp. paracasei Lpp219]|nr:hypothetical protein Lpp219_11186 [Lacticaseibacillus paracasei subsp. paracasei Lpp219]EPC88454.1 hypothetical protein Lpp43_00832 [Lacticaseibacillus paracasei subsp. paracasei Lpp43]
MVSEPAFAETGKLAQKSAHKDIEPKQPKLRQFCRPSHTRSQKPAFALHKKTRVLGVRGVSCQHHWGWCRLLFTLEE